MSALTFATLRQQLPYDVDPCERHELMLHDLARRQGGRGVLRYHTHGLPGEGSAYVPKSADRSTARIAERGPAVALMSWIVRVVPPSLVLAWRGRVPQDRFQRSALSASLCGRWNRSCGTRPLQAKTSDGGTTWMIQDIRATAGPRSAIRAVERSAQVSSGRRPNLLRADRACGNGGHPALPGDARDHEA